MTINSGIVTVTATATLLNTDNTPKGVSLASTVLIRNAGATVVYIGGEDVTADSVPATAGYPLAQNEVIAVATEGEEGVYGRVASGTAQVNVLRQGVV